MAPDSGTLRDLPVLVIGIRQLRRYRWKCSHLAASSSRLRVSAAMAEPLSPLSSILLKYASLLDSHKLMGI
jgi:hypothetical protein